MAAMFKVGKHEFIIRHPKQTFDRDSCEYEENCSEGEEPNYSYYSDMSDIRVEEVHPCKCTLFHYLFGNNLCVCVCYG